VFRLLFFATYRAQHRQCHSQRDGMRVHLVEPLGFDLSEPAAPV
jgi:hypothetical protein